MINFFPFNFISQRHDHAINPKTFVLDIYAVTEAIHLKDINVRHDKNVCHSMHDICILGSKQTKKGYLL